MQVTSIRVGWDSGLFGRFGIRNWDVTSLSDRLSDVHRHALYSTEFGPTWAYDWTIVEDWTFTTDLTRSWTICDGFKAPSSNGVFHWWQIDNSLENPYLVPFSRLRSTIRTTDFFYFKLGLRRKFAVWEALGLTPSVFVEGGNGNNSKRVFGKNINGDGWGSGGAGSVTFRLEVTWKFNEMFSAYAYVEQYEVVGEAARETNAASSYRCAHNDWTLGGVGVRLSF